MTLKTILISLSAGLLLAGCASSSNRDSSSKTISPKLAGLYDSPAFHRPRQPLVPVARIYTGDGMPIIRDVLQKSAAQKSGLRVGDIVLSLNGQKIQTISEFEKLIRHAPAHSEILFKRQGKNYKAVANLPRSQPRLGAGFEPQSVALVKRTSPLVAFMKQHELTAFAETTTNENQNELHLNLILESAKFIPSTQVWVSLTEKGKAKPFAQGFEHIDALGDSPHVFSEVFKKPSSVKGPVMVSLRLERKLFLFEFQ